MSKKSKRSASAQALARTGWEAKKAAIQCGGQRRAWTATNGRKQAARTACRGKVTE